MLKPGRNKILILLLLLLFVLLSVNVSAQAVIGNSKDWKDVYSIMLDSGFKGRRAMFLNSESLTSILRIVSKDTDLIIQQSNSQPYIGNLRGQLEASGYNVIEESSSNNLNLELDPQTGNYIVMSADNPRISISLAPLALKTNAWVLIVDEDNVGDVVNRIDGAQSVIGVGNFRRDLLDRLEPHFTERINNNDLFADSNAVAEKVGIEKNVILADGAFIEAEFFNKKNPVLISGANKILDNTYNFLASKDVKSVVIVGNELAVVGEQIRTKSDKKMSVFVKFGQSDASNTGKVYALTIFPLPQPSIGITVEKVIYDPTGQQLVAYYRNLGNAGIYVLSTLSVKNGEDEIGSASDAEVMFIGAGELFPQKYKATIPIDQINNETIVEFFTSYGLYPSQLDMFLTMKNQYGPPFSIPLTVEELGDDNSQITIDQAGYYKGLKRVGVTFTNTGPSKVYYSLKINDLIVNGLKESLFKEDNIAPGETKVTYIPVQLDAVDIDENDVFKIDVNYGKDPELMLKNIKTEIDFQLLSGGGLTGFVAGIFGEGSGVAVVVVIVLIAGLFGLAFYLKRKNR